MFTIANTGGPAVEETAGTATAAGPLRVTRRGGRITAAAFAAGGRAGGGGWLAAFQRADAAGRWRLLDTGGTPFQRRVWRALLEIPAGETRSYGELAAMIGRPGAARAVGRAVAANPVAVLIPCHRILPAGGGTGGYRWGPQRKRALLAAERGAAAVPA